MNMNLWRERILSSTKRIAVPIMTHPGIDMVGHSVNDAVNDGTVHFQAIKALAEKYPSAAACTIMDLTLEAEAFGAKILFSEDEIPTVEKPMIENASEIDRICKPSMDAGRLPEMIKACRMASENIKDRPVFGGVIGPYSLAGRLYGMTELMIGCCCEPDSMNALLEKCTDFLTEYCLQLKGTGINGIMMAEPAAGLLSSEDCVAFSSRYIKTIVDRLQDDNFIFILHNCGTSGHCLDAMLATGALGLHFGNKADIIDVLENAPDNILIMGNLDPVGVFLLSNPQSVYEETYSLLERTKKYRNFVLSSGCDVPPHIQNYNIEAFYKAVEDFNLIAL